MMTKTVNRDVANLKRSAEKINAGETERIATASPGDVVRQGDLYLVCLADAPKEGKIIQDRQLAPGTTQGSRHVVEGDCVIRTKNTNAIQQLHPSTPKELIGPSIECISDCPVTHPQHGDKILPGGTSWGVVYQRAFADEIRRIQD